jgi:hypothetical protein
MTATRTQDEVTAQEATEVAAESTRKPPYPFCCHPEKCIPTGRCERLRLSLSDSSITWVPVGERKPDPGIPVLAYCKNQQGRDRRLRAHWCPRWTVEAMDLDGDNESSEYSEEKDNYYVREGWYETNEFEECHWKIEHEVTHWMPLPEAPK